MNEKWKIPVPKKSQKTINTCEFIWYNDRQMILYYTLLQFEICPDSFHPKLPLLNSLKMEEQQDKVILISIFLYIKECYGCIVCMKYLLFSQVGFVLFNDIWSQYGHSVSCMTILYSTLANLKIGHGKFFRRAKTKVLQSNFTKYMQKK